MNNLELKKQKVKDNLLKSISCSKTNCSKLYKLNDNDLEFKKIKESLFKEKNFSKRQEIINIIINYNIRNELQKCNYNKCLIRTKMLIMSIIDLFIEYCKTNKVPNNIKIKMEKLQVLMKTKSIYNDNELKEITNYLLNISYYVK